MGGGVLLWRYPLLVKVAMFWASGKRKCSENRAIRTSTKFDRHQTRQQDGKGGGKEALLFALLRS